jgi:WD40 repeat protein
VAQALEAAQRGERAAAEILAASALTRGEFPDARGVLTTVDAEGLPQRLESWPSPRCEAREMSLDGHLLACARGDRILVWRPGEEPQIIRPMEATRLAFAGAEALVVSSQVTATTVLPLDGTARLATDLVGLTTPLSAPWANPAIWQQSSVLKRMDRRTGAIDMLPAPCLNTPWGLGLRAARAMPDGDLYLICGDGRLQVQNLHRLDPTREVGRYDKAWGEPVALDVWMAGGRGTAAVGTTYGHVVLFDLPSGSVRHVLGERGSSIHRLAAGERQVAVSPERGELQVWDIESGLQVVRLPVQRATLRWLERGRLRVWSEQVEDWRVPAEAPWLAVRSAEAGISRLDLSPDGSLIASAHGDGVVRIWDRYHSNPRQQLFLHQSVAKSVSFSPDGQSIAAIAAAENEVHIYSVADGKEQRRLAATRGRRVLWTERGLLLAPFTSDLWWWPELEAPPKVLSTGAKIFELTPEGGRILAEDALDRLWSVELHRSPPLRLEERPRGHIPFRRSPEMSWSSTRTAVTTHVEGRPYATAELADLELRNLHVVSGGKLLAAGHLDGTISLLALPSLERVATLRGHLSRISSLLSDPAGRFLYSGSWDGQLRAWDLAALEAEPTGLLRRLEAAWGRDAEALTLR